MTAWGGEHTLAPESSDGFASVGTASHRRRVALLPGGPFYMWKRSTKFDASAEVAKDAKVCEEGRDLVVLA